MKTQFFAADLETATVPVEECTNPDLVARINDLMGRSDFARARVFTNASELTAREGIEITRCEYLGRLLDKNVVLWYVDAADDDNEILFVVADDVVAMLEAGDYLHEQNAFGVEGHPFETYAVFANV